MDTVTEHPISALHGVLLALTLLCLVAALITPPIIIGNHYVDRWGPCGKSYALIGSGILVGLPLVATLVMLITGLPLLYPFVWGAW